MKKLVSLFLACLMLLSIAIVPAFATTETELYAGKEEALAVGDLTGTPTASGDFVGTNFTPTDAMLEKVKDGVGVEVKKDGENVYFELDGYNTRTDGYWSHKLYIYDYEAKSNSTKVKKYSALVSLPSTEVGVTNLFGQQDGKEGTAAVFNVKGNKGFGVQLKKGGAYYWDPTIVVDEEAGTKGEYVNFIPDGTMQADKYYRVEAIMDARGRTSLNETGPLYMRAFVYDGDTLLGETGWVLPTNYGYKYYLTGRITIIEAYGYPEDNCAVKVDEFKGYKLENLPAADVVCGTVNNKYVAAKTDNVWYRTVGERFNLQTTSKNNFLGNGSVNTAARYNLSFRIPEFGSTFYLIDFIGGRNMLISNTQADGIAMVNATGAFGAKAVDGTDVALTDGTSYQLTANTWYTLEALVDYIAFDEPKATIILKDAAGNVLTQSTQPYTISKIPYESAAPTYCQASIVWVGFVGTGKYIHFDNTEAYVAPTYADLLANTNLTTVIEEDFETYTGEEAQYYDVGDNYANLVGLDPIQPDADAEPDAKPTPASLQGATHVYNTEGAVKNINYAVIAADSSAEGLVFENGMTLPATKPLPFKVTYSNDIPNVNINSNNIKAYADGVELLEGMDYAIVAGNDGEIADSSKTINIRFKSAAPNTTYKLSLLAGLSDYNMSVSADNSIIMGVSAAAGSYDITFTTPDDVKATTISQTIVDEKSMPIASLENASEISGKVSIVNAGYDNIMGRVVLAVYDNGKLVALEISDEFIAVPGAVTSEATAAVSLDKEGLKAKVFVWDGFTSLLPLINEVVAQ